MCAGATALVATWSAWPLLWQTPFFLSFAAILAATHFCGAVAGGTTLALLAAAWLAFPPRPSSPTHLATAVFVVLGAIFIWMIARGQFLQRAFTAQEARLRLIVANIPIVMWALDRQGRFTLSEGRGLSAIGLRPGEVVGRSIDEVYADVPEIIDAARRTLAGESLTFTTRAAGRSFECWYAPLRTNTGELDGAIGVAADITARESAEAALREDITARRELERRLQHALKMEAVGRLAGGVAHDFNNLLTAILGYGELVLVGLPADDPRRADIAEIIGAAQRGAALTRQLLILGRRHVARPHIVDLNDVVTRTHRLLTRVLGEDITLTIRLWGEPLPVRIDVSQLEQVILNLAINARDAMADGGQLTIATECGKLEAERREEAPGGPSARLTITDTGSGMSPEVQARAFEPFFTTKPAGQGTGLGLSTVHGIVTESGGAITVDSAPGCGATFRIGLPIAPGAVEPLEESVASAFPARGIETILLVEDDAAVRVTASSILTRHGYTVLEARDAREALGRVGDGTRIDLLLTDIVMPGVSGVELARRLTEVLPRLRVLLMSGYHDRSPTVVSYPAEWAMIEKPFVPVTLLRAVREALDRTDAA